MKVRSRSLPPGWYPGGRSQTIREIEGFKATWKGKRTPARSGIAPHAGWAFSGSLACQVIGSIPETTETVVVVGGHLSPHSGILAASEGGYETPLGVITADLELLEQLRKNLTIRDDQYADNTVEVQLPFLKYFCPQAKALGLRASPSEEALQLGGALAAAARRMNRALAVVGSTDLTHYGSSYGFSPRGSGPEALRWVKEVNDKRLIDSLLTMKIEEALELAVNEQSACSVGGAAAACRFAQALGSSKGKLLEYRTSYDVYPGQSFVGYAGIIYPENG